MHTIDTNKEEQGRSLMALLCFFYIKKRLWSVNTYKGG